MKRSGRIFDKGVIFLLTAVSVAQSAIVAVWKDDANSSLMNEELTASGHSIVALSDLSTASLNGVDALFLMNSRNSGYSSAITSSTSAINHFVESGGQLHMWDRAIGNSENTASLLPGANNVTFVRKTSPNDLQIAAPEHAYLQGLNDASFDGKNHSAHGYATVDSLPNNTIGLLAYQGQEAEVVEFAYPLGSGLVHYSGIPADYYLHWNLSPRFNQSLSREISNIAMAIPEPSSVIFMTALTGLGYFIRRIING